MNNIENLREENNLSQKELSLKLEISQSAISEWEKDLRYPKIEHLIKMSELFKCSIDYIINKENDFGIIEIKNQLTEKESELLGYFRKLKAFERGQLIGIARTLAQGV